MQETLAPVVIFHAPLTLTIPSGMKNGTRLETLVAPPTNKGMEMALSSSVTTPGDVVAGVTSTPKM
jgi:hypothetical protein